MATASTLTVHQALSAVDIQVIGERVLARCVETPTGCWEWTGGKTAGYGYISAGGTRVVRVHRVVYAYLVAEIPDGLQLDHLCRNRACCNPEHLDPVPNRINWIRGDSPAARNVKTDTCQRGHSMADAYVRKSGGRRCRPCTLEYNRAYNRKAVA